MATLSTDFLPGTLRIERGTSGDYFALERFHYLPKRPATWAGVWVIRFFPNLNPEPRTPARRDLRFAPALNPPRVVAVGVLSYPSVSCRPRERIFELQFLTLKERVRWANANVRTISRVIVHPQFRALGLASMLVRRMLHDCPTRYVEALAIMGRAHPFFEKAGMRRIDPEQEDQPIYFIFDREEHSGSPGGTDIPVCAAETLRGDEYIVTRQTRMSVPPIPPESRLRFRRSQQAKPQAGSMELQKTKAPSPSSGTPLNDRSSAFGAALAAASEVIAALDAKAEMPSTLALALLHDGDHGSDVHQTKKCAGDADCAGAPTHTGVEAEHIHDTKNCYQKINRSEVHQTGHCYRSSAGQQASRRDGPTYANLIPPS